MHNNRLGALSAISLFKNIMLAGVAAALLVSCTNLDFDKVSFEPDLMFLGKQQAQYNCKKYGLNNDYRIFRE